MKEVDRAAQYWAAVKEKQTEIRELIGKVSYFVECNKELLQNRDYNGYIALLAVFAAYKTGDQDRTIYLKSLIDMYREGTGIGKQAAYENVNKTIKAIDWLTWKEGKYTIVDTAIDRYYNIGVPNAKIRGYIKLDETEITTLLQTKSSKVIKLYLRLKQLNAMSIKNNNLQLRSLTVTGPKGLAASLGYSPTNNKTIDEALEILQEYKLIAFTGDQYKPNNKGKYILINAIMGDDKQRWVSYNLRELSDNYILNNILNIQTPMGFETIKEETGSGNLFGYNQLEEIDYTN